jgi:hypothetical protein
MIAMTTNYNDAINASMRIIKAKAELYDNSALVATYTQNDSIKSINIERIGEDSKFFGVGITHKVNIKLIDVNREITLTTDNYFKIQIGIELNDDSIEYVSFPKVYITEVNRDENTNELSITTYDVLNKAKTLTINDLELTKPYTIKNVVDAIGAKIGADKTKIGKNLLKMPYNENNKLTDTAIKDDHNVITDYFVTLEAGKTYTISFESTADYGTNKGTETVEVFLLKDKKYEAFLQIRGKIYTFTPEVSGDYYLRYDINKNETTHSFWNFYIAEEEKFSGFEPYITAFDIEYTDGANFEGTEILKDVLTAAAEATQTIYFIDSNDNLVFKRLDRDGEAVKTISKANYITLDSKTNRRLATICHATELGDNVSASITEIGSTQYVRNNPFWELRADIVELLEDAKNAICGITINQFDCEWRGDLSLEPGDKIALVTKDNNKVISYLLNDVITYNGGLSQSSEWQYSDEEESESNPNTLGEAIKQTFARVDKANKQIDLVVSEVEDNNNSINSLIISTDSINASVQKDLNELTNKVNATMTAEDIKIEIQNELAEGVDKVTTKTGFTLNDEGLTVSKDGSEMTTTINEDGMTVYKDNGEMLKANNDGVIAYNLHAKTYLIVGESSRFEDYEKDGETRTGCFWIGGV